MRHEIKIPLENCELSGRVCLVKNTLSWVIFVHGSGSSHLSPRNNWVADEMNKRGYSTLLFDLLTPAEDQDYSTRFDILLLASRLLSATDWLIKSSYYQNAPIAFFGASAGAAAALVAASKLATGASPLYAIVSRGGRPDLAGENFLARVKLPTLLIVGAHDEDVIKLNERAQKYLFNSKIAIVPGATHLFEESGAMEEVVRLTCDWFITHLGEELTDQISL